jgi:dihydroorotate dehydrogenase (fumarate)
MAYDVNLAGMTLKNAIVTAAGPWAGSAEGIQRCIDAGAAAVLTETICLEVSSFSTLCSIQIFI